MRNAGPETDRGHSSRHFLRRGRVDLQRSDAGPRLSRQLSGIDLAIAPRCAFGISASRRLVRRAHGGGRRGVRSRCIRSRARRGMGESNRDRRSDRESRRRYFQRRLSRRSAHIDRSANRRIEDLVSDETKASGSIGERMNGMKIITLGVAVLVALVSGLQAAELNFARVDELTGLKGKLNEKEGAYKVTFPRADVAVTIDGWKMPPFMGLGTWAAFSKGERGPGIHPHRVVDIDAMHFRAPTDREFQHAVIRVAGQAEDRVQRLGRDRPLFRHGARAAERDRKSTRLNSSTGHISYAG